MDHLQKKSGHEEEGEKRNKMRTNALEYLEEAAERYADKAAFADDTDSCTFAELRDRAQRIGTALSKWFPPRKPVPVFMDKSVDTIGVFMGHFMRELFMSLLTPNTRQPVSARFWRSWTQRPSLLRQSI